MSEKMTHTRFRYKTKWLAVRDWIEDARAFEQKACSKDRRLDEGGGLRRLTLAGSNLHESHCVEVFSGCRVVAREQCRRHKFGRRKEGDEVREISCREEV